MTTYTNWIIYPEGEEQEIGAPLSIGDIVDLNGKPLEFPLPTPKVIAYRVIKILHSENRGQSDIKHWVELVPSRELLEFTR